MSTLHTLLLFLATWAVSGATRQVESDGVNLDVLGSGGGAEDGMEREDVGDVEWSTEQDVTTQGCIPGFTVMYYQNSKGGTPVTEVYDLEECKTACRAHDDCAAFDWSWHEHQNTLCWLHLEHDPDHLEYLQTQSYHRFSHQFIRSGCVEASTELDALPLGCHYNFTMHEGLQSMGASPIPRVYDLQLCKLHCLARADCVALDFGYEEFINTRCWLHTQDTYPAHHHADVSDQYVRVRQCE